MKIIKLFIIICFLTLYSTNITTAENNAKKFKLQVNNLSDTTRVYRLYWISHNLKNYFGDFNIATGELKSKRSNTANRYYEPGIYKITFMPLSSNYEAKTYHINFRVPETTKKIMINFHEPDQKDPEDKPIEIQFK